jgi:trigger factor
MTDETRTDQPEQPAAEDTATATQPPAAPPPEGEGAEAPEQELSKLVQTVEIKDIGPCKKHIKVQVDRASIDERLDAKFKELMPDANVHGFRPGKAPRALVRRHYRKDVGNQVKAELLLESLEQLAEEHDIAPLTAPDLDPFKVELPEAGPLVYEFEVEVRPHFDLPNYKGLRLRRPIKEFTEEDSRLEERRLLAPYGQLIPKPEGNAQVGDAVVADLTSRDGARVIGTVNEAVINVQPRLAFKDGVADRFGEQVQGAGPGDTRVVDITLSDRVADENLRGRTVQATLQIKDVKQVRLPELTHDFLHNFGVHTREQFEELVRVILQRRLEYTQRQSAREQVAQHIAATASWELPRDLLIRQARKAMNRQVMEMRANGMSDDEIRGRQRLLQQDVVRSTELALKEHFVLQKIAEVEKINVKDEDLEDEIDRIAERNNESPRRVRAHLEKEDLMESLAAELIERKALDLILESAEYEDVPLGGAEQAPVATIEQQAVPGEMKDLTEAPAEETAPAEGSAAPEQQ